MGARPDAGWGPGEEAQVHQGAEATVNSQWMMLSQAAQRWDRGQRWEWNFQDWGAKGPLREWWKIFGNSWDLSQERSIRSLRILTSSVYISRWEPSLVNTLILTLWYIEQESNHSILLSKPELWDNKWVLSYTSMLVMNSMQINEEICGSDLRLRNVSIFILCILWFFPPLFPFYFPLAYL